MPNFAAIGINPISVASVVINTGRNLTRGPSATASRKDRPSARSRLMNSTIRMLSETEMPTTNSIPINDMTLIGVPVIYRINKTPVNPGGTASKIRTGSRNERNCATKIR